MNVLHVQVSDRHFALPATSVERIALRALEQPYPHPIAWVLGYAWMRGRLRWVVDLGGLLGLPAAPRAINAHWVLLRPHEDGLMLAFEVARVHSLLSVSPATLRPLAPGETFQGAAAAVLSPSAGPESCILLAPERLLLQFERERLSIWQAQLEERARLAEASP